MRNLTRICFVGWLLDFRVFRTIVQFVFKYAILGGLKFRPSPRNFLLHYPIIHPKAPYNSPNLYFWNNIYIMLNRIGKGERDLDKLSLRLDRLWLLLDTLRFLLDEWIILQRVEWGAMLLRLEWCATHLQLEWSSALSSSWAGEGSLACSWTQQRFFGLALRMTGIIFPLKFLMLKLNPPTFVFLAKSYYLYGA